MTHRNLCFKLAYDEQNENCTLQPTGIDNETFFATCPSRLNAILNFGISCQSLHPAVRDIILSWNEEDLRSYTDQITELHVPDANAVNNQCQRISDLQNFITLHPNASPRDILLYAFFNTSFHIFYNIPYSDTSYTRKNIYGIKILEALSLGGFEEQYNVPYDHLGNYFKKHKGFDALKFSYEKFQEKYCDDSSDADLSSDESLDFGDESNQENVSPREIKDFSDFIDYLLRNEDPNFIGTIDDIRTLGLMGSVVGIKNKISFFENL